MADNNSPTSMVVLNKSDVTRDKPLYFFLEHYQAAFVAEMQAFVNSIDADSWKRRGHRQHYHRSRAWR